VSSQGGVDESPLSLFCAISYSFQNNKVSIGSLGDLNERTERQERTEEEERKEGSAKDIKERGREGERDLTKTS
jgi:hypothetical protein